jgi:ABC-2 type transport system ATP-binding protein
MQVSNIKRSAMPAVEVNHVTKYFGDKAAVNDLSFSVAQGEIFGLIGPNGAGKSTTIRMMMDILKPDTGDVAILGEKFSEATKNKLGYMPEERGLYRKMRAMDSIIYLASLKGMESRAAEKRADELLSQMALLPHKNKKIDELSKGMGQIIQFIVTIIHSPELIILDEPFSGLDPVNTELMKKMFSELRNQGKALVLSTHQMNQVEELCDRILMINNGRSVLYGDLQEIKARYKSNSMILEYEGEMKQVPGIAEMHLNKGHIELVLDGKSSPHQILKRLVDAGVEVNRFEAATPSLNEIFLKVAGKKNE